MMFLKIVQSVRSLSVRSMSTKDIGIIGVPFDKGAGKRGMNDGPNALRKAGLIEDLQSISDKINIKDYGNMEYELMKPSGRKIDNLKELGHVASCNKKLAHKIEEILNDNRMPITLGGDHSIAIGSISGLLTKVPAEKLAVLWVDAHIDLNTNSTSPSGNMHGKYCIEKYINDFFLLYLQ